MSHISAEVLAALRAGNRVSRREYAHVDGCLRCHRVLGSELPAAPPRPRSLWLIAVAVLAIVASIVVVAPLRAAALGFVEIFEPQHIVIIPMTVEDFKQMASVPDFKEFGTASEVLESTHAETTDLRAAEAAAGFRLRLPPEIAGSSRPYFTVNGPFTEQFVFSDAIARASAARAGRQWQPMPAGMDGSVMRVAFGSGVIASYANGFWMGSQSGAARSSSPRFHSTVRGERAEVATSGVGIVYSGRGARPRGGRLDGLLIAQMPVPKVGSTGTSVQALERYMLDRPGVSPRLAAAIGSLRDPTTTLVVPVPADRAYAQPVVVAGVWGTLIGDNTGLGALVFWERDGFLYAVGGTRSASDIVAVADSLQ